MPKVVSRIPSAAFREGFEAAYGKGGVEKALLEESASARLERKWPGVRPDLNAQQLQEAIELIDRNAVRVDNGWSFSEAVTLRDGTTLVLNEGTLRYE